MTITGGVWLLLTTLSNAESSSLHPPPPPPPPQLQQQLQPPQSASSGCTYLLATFPFSGNTWLRNVWDIATGIGAESAYPEQGTLSKNNLTYGSDCGANNGNNHRHAYQMYTRGSKNHTHTVIALAAQIERNEHTVIHDFPCGFVKRANATDPLLVKTHFPVLQLVDGEYKRYSSRRNICAVILAHRDYMWCEHHKLERKFWATVNTKNDTYSECKHEIANKIITHNMYWKKKADYLGIPVVVFNFSNAILKRSVAVAEFKRVFKFINISITPERMALATLLHIY